MGIELSDEEKKEVESLVTVYNEIVTTAKAKASNRMVDYVLDASVPDENNRICVFVGYANELVVSVIVDEPFANVITSCLPIENLRQQPLTYPAYGNDVRLVLFCIARTFR